MSGPQLPALAADLERWKSRTVLLMDGRGRVVLAGELADLVIRDDSIDPERLRQLQDAVSRAIDPERLRQLQDAVSRGAVAGAAAFRSATEAMQLWEAAGRAMQQLQPIRLDQSIQFDLVDLKIEINQPALERVLGPLRAGYGVPPGAGDTRNRRQRREDARQARKRGKARKRARKATRAARRKNRREK